MTINIICLILFSLSSCAFQMTDLKGLFKTFPFVFFTVTLGCAVSAITDDHFFSFIQGVYVGGYAAALIANGIIDQYHNRFDEIST